MSSNSCLHHHHHDHEINEINAEHRAENGLDCSLFESPIFNELFHGAIRPGGLAVTKEAVTLSQFPEHAKLLDVGCGGGTTVAFLKEEFGFDSMGVDPSQTLLDRGKELHPDQNLMYGDGELLGFRSNTFDGVFMECVLSLMEMPMEALHEAYCVLKKGGKLVISDFYEKGALPPIKGGSKWEPREMLRSCIEGAFDVESLRSMVTELGFHIVHWKDHNTELQDFTATLLLNYGSMDEFFQAAVPEGETSSYLSEVVKSKKLGYFLMVAEKL
jgi:SAM-dependent methyltransferase